VRGTPAASASRRRQRARVDVCGERLWAPTATARGTGGEHVRISASTSGRRRRALDAGRRRRGQYCIVEVESVDLGRQRLTYFLSSVIEGRRRSWLV
jgi:hypothetical protein